jgi:hypothetical protein
MTMPKFLVVMSFATFVLVGCQPSSGADNQAGEKLGQGKLAQALSASASSVPVQPNVTAEQWTHAVGQVFDKVSVKRLRDKRNPDYVEDEGKTDANGVTEFFACFDKAPPKCELPSSGRRDGFRKVQFFKDPGMEWSDLGAKYTRGTGKTSVRAYVSLKDCYRPMFLLQPTFRAANWIFLERFGLMLDGAIVIDRKFDSSQVDRDNSHNEVSESVHIGLDQQEVNALRRVVEAKEVLIRLTGQKGYVEIDQEGTRNFVQGVTRLLRMHDALGQAVDRLGQVKDPACPA